MDPRIGEHLSLSFACLLFLITKFGRTGLPGAKGNPLHEGGFDRRDVGATAQVSTSPGKLGLVLSETPISSYIRRDSVPAEEKRGMEWE